MQFIEKAGLSMYDRTNITFGICYNINPSDDLLDTETNIKTKIFNFKPHDIKLSQFKNLFYQNELGIYYINEVYKDSEFINFGKQKITDRDGTYKLNKLNEYVISTYEEILNVSRDNFNDIILMNLNRELLKINSLCDICNIKVFHTFKELENIYINYSDLNTRRLFNFKFIYKNEIFKDIQIVFNFYYDVDFS